MASKTCPTCGGSGYNAMRGVMPGSQKNGHPCTTCRGSGWIYDNTYRGVGSNENKGCFTGDSKIMTPNGWKEIHQLKPNDFVASIDNLGNRVYKKILKVKIHEDCIVQPILTSKKLLKVTPSHSIQLSNGTWVKAKKLNKGDTINYLDDNGYIREHVVVSKNNKSTTTVYNLIVEDTYTFVVDGCVAHSFTYFKKLRSFFYSIFYYKFISTKKESYGIGLQN